MTIQIKTNPNTQYVVLCENDTAIRGLDTVDQKIIAEWLCNHRPELVRSVICEMCLQKKTPYFANESERGRRG